MATPEEMMAAVSASMRQRTGRSLDEWVAAVQSSGINPLDQNAVRRWLKAEHGVPQNSQWAIAFEAARAAGWVEPTVEDYIAKQYEGAKAPLRPIYDAVASAALELGDDVRAEGRSTYVPFVRARQFAAVQPSTRSRVDLGLRFVEPPATSRLQPANNLAQATHKIELMSAAEVDDEVRSLLKVAYDQNG
jgi:predicted transport protein